MHRRQVIKLGAAAVAASLQPSITLAETVPAANPATDSVTTVEQWGLFDLPLKGPATGNPFQEIKLEAIFSQGHRNVRVAGFYDGDATYRIRFMPDATGPWTWKTSSSVRALDNQTGALTVIAPTPGNHGPIGTAHQFHFQHADSTPYFPFGTTTYAMLFATDANAQASLAGMKIGNFNKTRVCVLPKPLGKGPQMLPFPTTGLDPAGHGGTADFTRFNPAYFQMLERRILMLQQAGVQADLILFHPYDAWGYKAMPNAVDDFYLRYAVARLSAYRNVWWAIANEYDLVKAKTMSDWDRFFRIVQAEDPYSHLRSIHHSRVIYDQSKPWVTHASLQSYDFEKSAARREAWNKPIIYDEIQYEGDVDRRWGNLSAEEMTHRFYLATVHGVYATHGEVFGATDDDPNPPKDQGSWSDSGPLRGESGPRIGYLRDLIQKSTKTGYNESEGAYYLNAADAAGNIFYYFDYHRPARYDFPLPTNGIFSASLIDPFAMTSIPIPGTHTGKSRIKLPSKPYHAVLFTKIADAKGKPASNEPKVPNNEPVVP